MQAKGDGNAGKTAEGIYNDLKEPRAVEVLGDSSHGTFIFEDLENAEIHKNLILEFLKKY